MFWYREAKKNKNETQKINNCVRQYHVKSISFCDCDDLKKNFILFM